jgi:hypothetical protein
MAEKKRSYGIAPDELKALKAEFADTKRFPVPYSKGAYRFTLEAMLELGPDEFHPLAEVQKAFAKAAGAEWYAAWANKDARSDKGKDADGRFVQNLKVLQRTRDFGKRLLDVGRRVIQSKGAVIDLARDDAGALLARLNLDSATPQKAGRLPKESDSAKATTPLKPRPKAKKKSQKARPKGKGRKPSPDAGAAGEQP